MLGEVAEVFDVMAATQSKSEPRLPIVPAWAVPCLRRWTSTPLLAMDILSDVHGRVGGKATVGRHAELDGASRWLAGAQAGRGGSALISGEAGIGKSHLLDEVGRMAQARSMTTLYGRSVPGGGPFRPVAQALMPTVSSALIEHPQLVPFRGVLGRLLPGWTDSPRADGALVDPIVLLGEAVRELLRVAGEPAGLVLALDDLHWADPDTLALVDYLVGRVADVRVLVLCAARDEEQLPAELAQLCSNRAMTVVRLPRLSAADIAALARERAGGLPGSTVDVVVRASDGLPLLTEELVDALVGDDDSSTVPHTVAALTHRRLRALPSTARNVIQVTAVMSAAVEWEMLPAATGLSAREVARALRAGVDAALLVRDDSAAGSLRWRHALTRDAVLAQLLPPERVAIAHAAAEALEAARLVSGSVPALDSGERDRIVAELYAQCGQGSAAARLLLAPARGAVRAGALCSAEATLRRAAELAPDDHDVAVELVRVLTYIGRAAEAEELGAEVRAAVHGEQLMLLCLHLARSAAAAERWSAALAFLAPVAATGDSRVDAIRAHVALGENHLDRAVELARAAARRGMEDGQPEAVCEALQIEGRALRRTDPEASNAAMVETARYAQQHGLAVWRIRALLLLGVNDVSHPSRRDRLTEARSRAQEAGMLATVAALDVHIGACVALCDGHVAMLPFAHKAIALADQLGLAPVGASARFFAAIGHLFADDREPMATLLDEARALAPESMDTSAHFADVEGMAAWVDGDLALAVAVFDRNTDRRRRNQGDIASPLWGVRALLRTVLDPADPGPRDDLLSAEIRRHICNEGARHYAEAVAAVHVGQLDRAEQFIADGDRVLAGHRAWRHLLRLELVGPVVGGGCGTTGAERWLRAAFADFSAAGEVCLLRRCRALMNELAIPVPRSHHDAAAMPVELRERGVTAREWQVLELIEHGLTNSQIGTRLFVSPRTVESHVANLLRKTGRSRRIQLRSR